jgi:hypothetical protein
VPPSHRWSPRRGDARGDARACVPSAPSASACACASRASSWCASRGTWVEPGGRAALVTRRPRHTYALGREREERKKERQTERARERGGEKEREETSERERERERASGRGVPGRCVEGVVWWAPAWRGVCPLSQLSGAGCVSWGGGALLELGLRVRILHRRAAARALGEAGQVEDTQHHQEDDEKHHAGLSHHAGISGAQVDASPLDDAQQASGGAGSAGSGATARVELAGGLPWGTVRAGRRGGRCPLCTWAIIVGSRGSLSHEYCPALSCE